MIAVLPRKGETLDAIADGRIRLLQRKSGYRFNLDAVLLAGFGLEGRDAERPTQVVDLGTGCGIVALMLAAWRPAWEVTAIEVQPSLADLARRNVALNQLQIEVVEGDWRSRTLSSHAGKADLVVCNPPYFAPDKGQPCTDAERAAARQEMHGTIEDAARAARRFVRARGYVRFIYAASRFPELLTALRTARLPVVRMRMVHAKPDEPAYAVLTESIPDSKRPLLVEPPLIVHGANGTFTPEVAALVSPKAEGVGWA